MRPSLADELAPSAFALALLGAAALAAGCDARPSTSTAATGRPAGATSVAASGGRASAQAPRAATTAVPYPSAQASYSADRLHERVDGAAEQLRAAGCQKLLYWRIESPPVDVELLVFGGEAGARAILDRDTGSERSAGSPGDEGWANEQVAYFRRGSSYARLIADQALAAGMVLAEAKRLDQALAAGAVAP